MKRFKSSSVGVGRFSYSHPHQLNRTVGYRGGIRK